MCLLFQLCHDHVKVCKSVTHVCFILHNWLKLRNDVLDDSDDVLTKDEVHEREARQNMQDAFDFLNNEERPNACTARDMAEVKRFVVAKYITKHASKLRPMEWDD